MGGYLKCDKCEGYYELQPGELPGDFNDICDCGGKLRFVETIYCPYCFAKNPEDNKICISCNRVLKPNKTTPPRYKTTQRSTKRISGGNKRKTTAKTFNLMEKVFVQAGSGILLIIIVIVLLSFGIFVLMLC